MRGLKRRWRTRPWPRQSRIVGHCDDCGGLSPGDIAILPTTVPESCRAAVEPQAMGRPVIASHHGAYRDGHRRGLWAWLVPPADPDAWAAAMIRAIDLGPGKRARNGSGRHEPHRQLYRVDAMCARRWRPTNGCCRPISCGTRGLMPRRVVEKIL